MLNLKIGVGFRIDNILKFVGAQTMQAQARSEVRCGVLQICVPSARTGFHPGVHVNEIR
jgi:hypothetical protein